MSPRLVEVSVPVRPGMPVYPGDPEVHLEEVLSISGGDLANVSRMDLGVHTGTHVDAPRHFLDDGPGADALALDVLVGAAVVADARAVRDRVDLAALDVLGLPAGTERLLLRTRNSELWAREGFAPDTVTVAADAARAMVDRGVRLVGVDSLSVGDPETHRVLLGAGVVVVEGLDLREAPPGACRLICLPLRLVGADGAPARAVLEVP